MSQDSSRGILPPTRAVSEDFLGDENFCNPLLRRIDAFHGMLPASIDSNANNTSQSPNAQEAEPAESPKSTESDVKANGESPHESE